MMGPSQPIIRDIWNDNLEIEMARIRELVEKYNYVAMDTEYPGVVVKAIGTLSLAEYNYQNVRCNVEMMKLIQLGISLFDENGNHPDIPTFQFNFKYNLDDEMHSEKSINLLKQSGIDFNAHRDRGIDPIRFGELFITSGLAFLDNVKWISFHSNYDFAYLLKVLTAQALPNDEREFFNVLRAYFPYIYDIKHMIISCKNLKNRGLSDIASILALKRTGNQHQAGSDSLLTGDVFFKIRQVHFDGIIDDSKYCGVIYGLTNIWPSVSISSDDSSISLSTVSSASSSSSSIRTSTSGLEI